MRPAKRVARDVHGEWTSTTRSPTEGNPEDIFDGQKTDYPTPPEQTVHESNRTEGLSFFELHRIAVNTKRAMRCLWIFALAMRVLTVLIKVSLWCSFFIFIKTLFFWNGAPLFFRILVEYLLSRAPWEFLVEATFPVEERHTSYQLHVRLSGNADPAAGNLFRVAFPMRLRNPIIWAMILLYLYALYPLVRFLHGCLQHAMEVSFFHQTLEKDLLVKLRFP